MASKFISPKIESNRTEGGTRASDGAIETECRKLESRFFLFRGRIYKVRHLNSSTCISFTNMRKMFLEEKRQIDDIFFYYTREIIHTMINTIIYIISSFKKMYSI